ncbi:MAG: pyridoxal phosphate-dependent aminotransferase [Cytophagales bacterium]|nr:MAG: pyridoxal phosphate-dependent aminotransferase [Cytophagales bacterium]
MSILTNDILSDRINGLAESQTIAMAKKARELAAAGNNVVNLTLGEPDFATPMHIKEAGAKAIMDNFSYYTPVAGIPELRKGIAEKLKRDNNIDWKAENIIVSTGAKQSLANALSVLVNPGDEVIIYSPYWVSYAELVKLYEGEVVELVGTFANDFKPTIQDLKNAITDRTKVIMYSSPCNPTGTVFSKDELLEIAKVVEENENIYVIADEIYEYINYGEPHFSIGSVDAIKDKVITVNGFSKGYAMTGWRVGYMAAHKTIADACDKMQSQITSGTCSIAQKAALAGINADLSSSKEMTKTFSKRRDLMYGLLSEIKGLKINNPKGAFYFFPDISAYFGKSDGNTTIKNSEDFSNWLLTKYYMSTVPGSAFGYEGCIRISYAAADEKLIEGCKRLKEACNSLK